MVFGFEKMVSRLENIFSMPKTMVEKTKAVAGVNEASSSAGAYRSE